MFEILLLKVEVIVIYNLIISTILLLPLEVSNLYIKELKISLDFDNKRYKRHLTFTILNSC